MADKIQEQKQSASDPGDGPVTFLFPAHGGGGGTGESSSFDGMSILYIVLAVIAALVVIYLLFTHVGPAVMDILMNSFGSSGPEYQLSQAFGIVN